MTSHLRRIAHLDMDAFFASIELLRYPKRIAHLLLKRELAPLIFFVSKVV